MLRYKEQHGITSRLDPIQDVLCLIEYLTVDEYLRDLLQKTHGLSAIEAKMRAKVIIPHAKVALTYIKDGLKGNEDLSFLPLYYGLLNLSKVYILMGPHHARLSSERWHGASYNQDSKDSRSLKTETVSLKSKGAISLFYETLTGKPMPAIDNLSIGDVMSYITNVGAEYALANGHKNNVVTFKIGSEQIPNKADHHIPTLTMVRIKSDTKKYKKSGFRGLKGFKHDSSTPDLYVGKELKTPCTFGDPRYAAMFTSLLIYDVFKNEDSIYLKTPYCTKRLLLPEEFPVLILFFYMSSVVRYKPDFLAKIRQSKYWPILSASRQHCIYRMLVLAWSYAHKRELRVSSEAG